MPSIAEQARAVTAGVDTHAEVHVAAVVDQVGRVVGSEAFAAWSDEPIPRHRRVIVVDALSARSVLVTPSPV